MENGESEEGTKRFASPAVLGIYFGIGAIFYQKEL